MSIYSFPSDLICLSLKYNGKTNQSLLPSHKHSRIKKKPETYNKIFAECGNKVNKNKTICNSYVLEWTPI